MMSKKLYQIYMSPDYMKKLPIGVKYPNIYYEQAKYPMEPYSQGQWNYAKRKPAIANGLISLKNIGNGQ